MPVVLVLINHWEGVAVPVVVAATVVIAVAVVVGVVVAVAVTVVIGKLCLYLQERTRTYSFHILWELLKNI